MKNRRIVIGRQARAAIFATGVMTSSILLAGAALASTGPTPPSSVAPKDLPAAVPAGGQATDVLRGLSGVAQLGGVTGLGSAAGGSALRSVPAAKSVPAVKSVSRGLKGMGAGPRLGSTTGITRARASRNTGSAADLHRLNPRSVPASKPLKTGAVANAVRGLMLGRAGQLFPGLSNAASAVQRARQM